MTLSLRTIELGRTVLMALIPGMVWHWATARGQSRAGTYFGARVEEGFGDSSAGLAILTQFRQRLWGWLLAGMVLCLAMVAWAPESSGFHSGWAFLAASLLECSVGVMAFALAHQRTRLEASGPTEPRIRIASLDADERPEEVWLQALDWLAMLAPPFIPIATLMALGFYWPSLSSASAERWISLGAACSGLGLGWFSTANHWALLYRTLSRDWALTASASHRYRTYLGLPMACLMTLLIAQLCITNLVPLGGSVAWLRHWNMLIINKAFMSCMLVVGVFGWSMRVWLSKHRDRTSGDPMADKYWKWGQFYCNPGDPAVMVPMRTGDMYSPNYSRLSVRVACGTVFVVLIGFVVQLGYARRAQDRETERLTQQVQREISCEKCGPAK
jgi:hypothetical protein